MSLISQIKEIEKKFLGQILFDESLSKYSWFNLGGPAKVIFKPKNLNELSIFLKNAKGFDKIKVLGVGSNTLIRDGGFNGVIIKFGKSFSHISLFDKNTLIAGASILEKNLSNEDYNEVIDEEDNEGLDALTIYEAAKRWKDDVLTEHGWDNGIDTYYETPLKVVEVKV